MYQYEETAAECNKIKPGVLEDPHKTLKYYSRSGNGRNGCKVLAFFHFKKSGKILRSHHFAKVRL